MYLKKTFLMLFMFILCVYKNALEGASPRAAKKLLKLTFRQFHPTLPLLRKSPMEGPLSVLSTRKAPACESDQKVPATLRPVSDLLGHEFVTVINSACQAYEANDFRELLVSSKLMLNRTSISDLQLLALMCMCTQLKSLSLQCCDMLENPSIKSTSLETLVLGGRKVTNAMVGSAIQGCPNLRHLELIACGELKDLSIESSVLQRLSLLKCGNICAESIKAICRKCPGLRFLNVTGTQATQEIVNLIQKIYPDLEVKFSVDEAILPEAADWD